MRINFNAPYNDIQRLLNPKATGNSSVKGGIGFDSALAQASSNTDNKVSISEPLGSVDGLASLSPKVSLPASWRDEDSAVPEMELPKLEPKQMPASPSESVKDGSPSVKTPTVLGVRRIELSADQVTPQISKTESNSKSHLEELVRAAGIKEGIDPALTLAVVKNESSFNPKAVSSDGHASKGLFQLLDSTGKQIQERMNVEGEYDPFDPEFNTKLGVSYLRYLHGVFSEPTALGSKFTTARAADSASLEKLAVAAFNAGEGRVASAQGRAEQQGKNPGVYEDVSAYLPKSTQQYVKRVISSKNTE